MAEWYTKIAEQVVGPLSAEQLKALAAGGRLAPGDPVSKSKEGPWVPASRVKGLFEVAAIDDQSDEEIPAAESVAGHAPPPIPQPPVVVPRQSAAQTSTSPLAAVPPVEAAPPSVESAPVGGFAIHTEAAATTERFQKKKRTKKPREPLTKKQKNARMVKWLAVSIVAGIVVLVSIPFLRKLVRSTPEPVAAKSPVATDVDLAVSGNNLDGAFETSSSTGRSRPASSAAGRTGVSKPGSPIEPTGIAGAAPAAADSIAVKARYVLDRPKMTSADGREARPAKPFLFVELELETKDPDASARFRGWIDYAKEISLTDDHGVQYKVRLPRDFGGMFVDGQCRETVFLSAEKPTTDVVVFAWPEGETPELPSNSDESLKLRLPRAAYGEQGELLIEIPLSKIEVTEAALEKPRGGPPAVMGGTSDNMEEDNGGPIRIPGLTE